jgi:hypothetical protein
MKIAAALAAMALLASCATTGAPPAADGDELQIEATVLAVYNVISGPAGRRDWNRFEELFAPGAQMIVAAGQKTTVLTPKDYIARSTPVFNEKGWFERPVSTRIVRSGDIAHVWSPYEGRAASSQEKADVRGINSFQLVRIGGAWKVQSILWQQEQ